MLRSKPLPQRSEGAWRFKREGVPGWLLAWLRELAYVLHLSRRLRTELENARLPKGAEKSQ
jgi:hypothetical protein